MEYQERNSILCNSVLGISEHLMERAANAPSDPDLATWLLECEAKLNGLGLPGIKDELIARVQGRQKVCAAIPFARSGNSPEAVIDTLWPGGATPDEYSGRFSLATDEERRLIGSSLRPYLEAMAVETFDHFIWHPSTLDRIPSLEIDEPFCWRYYTTFAHLGGILLDPKFHEVLSFCRFADDRHFQNVVLPLLPPGVILSILNMPSYMVDELVDLIGHSTLKVRSAALFSLLDRLEQSRITSQKAIDIGAKIEHGDPRAEAELDALIIKYETETSANEVRMRAVADLLRPNTMVMFSVLIDLVLDARCGTQLHTLFVHLLSESNEPDLRTIVETELAKLRNQENPLWRQLEVLAEVAHVGGHTGLFNLICGYVVHHFLGSEIKYRPSLVGAPIGLIVNGLIGKANQDSEAFKQYLFIVHRGVMEAWSGRPSASRQPLLDEASLHSYTALEAYQAKESEFGWAIWLEIIEWIRGVIKHDPHGIHNILGMAISRAMAVMNDEPKSIDAVVKLLATASKSAHLTHEWCTWLPGDPILRVHIIKALHDRVLHEMATFLLEIKSGNHFPYLLRTLLETECSECCEKAISRLSRQKDNVLGRVASVSFQKKKYELNIAIRGALRMPIHHPLLVDLRRAVVDEVGRTAGIDVSSIEMEYGWARNIEHNGLADQSSQFWFGLA